MLVSTTVVSTRMRRPSVKPWLCAMVTILVWICLITSPPSATPQRPIVLASGVFAPPTRVKSRFADVLRARMDRIAPFAPRFQKGQIDRIVLLLVGSRAPCATTTARSSPIV